MGKAASRVARPHLQIVPHQGVGSVRFGMKRREVRAAMKDLGLELSSADGAQDFFGAENALQVEHDHGTASFIGVSSAKGFGCSIYGVDPFDLPAKELFALLRKHDGGKGYRFDEYEQCFRTSIVTLYDADEQYDRQGKGRVMWSQIGLGDARYLKAIDEIDD